MRDREREREKEIEKRKSEKGIKIIFNWINLNNFGVVIIN